MDNATASINNGKYKPSGKTRDCINPSYRHGHEPDLRYNSTTGTKLSTASRFDEVGERIVCKYIGKDSVPLKILPLAAGAPSIRNIIFNGNETIVVFDNGDRVSVACAKEDGFDRHTAVAWALAKYILGNNIGRRIDNAIKRVGVDASREKDNRKCRKEIEKIEKRRKLAEKGKLNPIYG